jgi:hypothetical protein
MRASRVRFSVKGMLIGMVCGALVGVLIYFVSRVSPPKNTPGAALQEFVTAAEHAGIMAIIGGLAGGVLQASGWAMFVGGILGALVFGIFGVVLTFHLKGLVYSILGAPVGAVLVYIDGVSHEIAKPSDNANGSPKSAGVWDREMDV